jgi:hypothetical protein
MNEIVVVDFRPYEKNTLKGFVTLEFAGLILREVCLHEKNGKRWTSMPARPYKRPDGANAWQPLVEFADEATRTHFQEFALKAVDTYRGGDKKCN